MIFVTLARLERNLIRYGCWVPNAGMTGRCDWYFASKVRLVFWIIPIGMFGCSYFAIVRNVSRTNPTV